jgi:hypothetical protein
MEHSCKIRAILDEADQRLLDLIAECATAGDLPGVDASRSVAGRIRSLRDSLENGEGESLPPGLKRSRQSRSSRQRKRAGKKPKFPRFELRNATLYRIGWSKKKNEQYEHRVPYDTVKNVVNAMVSLGQSRPGPFTVEQIARRSDQTSDISVPSYQVYVVIGWLRAHDLIEQVGRDGYQMPGNLGSDVEALWES